MRNPHIGGWRFRDLRNVVFNVDVRMCFAQPLFHHWQVGLFFSFIVVDPFVK